MEGLPTFSIEEKRQVVFSSLYRYASEAMPLRERALKRVILGALIGSSEKEPFRIGHIQGNLSFGSINSSLRAEIIQEVLNLLISEEKVDKNKLRERHAYFLTQRGEAEITTLMVSSAQLFLDVSNLLFRDTTNFIPLELSSQIFRKFAFECFSRYGLDIAKTTAGKITREELSKHIDARATFEAAIIGFSLTSEQRESLEARCHHFLFSSDPLCERLKFYLTQGFYFTQLIGLDLTRFNPVAEQAFKGAVFYLDTNVLLLGLLYTNENADQFEEMVKLAKRLGIEPRVTRATINETKRVISDRIPQIKRITEVVPNELIEKTSDQILKAYLVQREMDPNLTIEKFIDPFINVEARLEDWQIIIEELDETAIIGDRDTTQIEDILNEEANNSRGWGKSSQVLKHDAAHFLLIFDERVSNPKSWFLTRDRSLEMVSDRLKPEEPPFCFSHIGFLQSISPFVTTADEELSLADVMSTFMCDQIRPIETLFDISELALMAEFHEDVMATPVDQLVMAFDYIKSHILKGENYRRENIPVVSLEIRKFLSVSREEQMRTLLSEKERLAEEAKLEVNNRVAAEEEVARVRHHELELEDEVQHLRNILDETRQTVRDITERLSAKERQTTREEQRNRLIFAIVCAVIGLTIISELSNLKMGAAVLLPGLAPSIVNLALRLISTLLLTIPFFLYIRNTSWADIKQTAFISVVIIVSLALTNLIPKESISQISDYFGIGIQLATIIVAAWLIKRDP